MTMVRHRCHGAAIVVGGALPGAATFTAMDGGTAAIVADFSAQLGARNDVSAAPYAFIKKMLSSRSGKYSTHMIAECQKVGMKPVCDHPSYCRNDANSLYIGQANHIAYPPHRKINSWFPSGWSSISNKWDSLCVYTANRNGNYALCNIPFNRHTWRRPSQYNPGFICGAKGILGELCHKGTESRVSTSPLASACASRLKCDSK